MQFLGEYFDLIENGKVSFPWNVDENEKLTWMIAEITKDSYKTIHCEIFNSDEFENFLTERSQQSVVDFKILNTGELLLDDDMWQVPEEILSYLKTNELTFLGAVHFVEIFSSEDMSKFRKLFEKSEYELKEIVSDDGFQHECPMQP